MEAKQFYKDIANDEYQRRYENVRAIQFHVSLRARKSRGWIARQQLKNEWFGFAFIVGDVHLFIDTADVMHNATDKMFIDKYATEVLGYPPDSVQHIEAQIAEYDELIVTSENEKTAIATRINNYQHEKRKLEVRLAESLRN